MKRRKSTFGFEEDLYVRCYGNNRELTPLVYLHGLGDSGLCFLDVVAELTDKLGRRRQLIPDLPGYGRSRTALPAPSLVEMADRIAMWLKNRGEKRVDLVGHSMGGVVALMLAERHPELVAGIVDIEGNKTSADCSLSRLPEKQSIGEFLTEGFEAMTRQILLNAIPERECLGCDDPAYIRYYQSLQVCNPQAFFSHADELVGLSEEGQLAARLGGLDCAKFFVVGHPWGSGDISRKLVRLEGIPVFEVHPSGHWPFVDHPDLCAWVIARALNYSYTPVV